MLEGKSLKIYQLGSHILKKLLLSNDNLKHLSPPSLSLSTFPYDSICEGSRAGKRLNHWFGSQGTCNLLSWFDGNQAICIRWILFLLDFLSKLCRKDSDYYISPPGA